MSLIVVEHPRHNPLNQANEDFVLKPGPGQGHGHACLAQMVRVRALHGRNKEKFQTRNYHGTIFYDIRIFFFSLES